MDRICVGISGDDDAGICGGVMRCGLAGSDGGRVFTGTGTGTGGGGITDDLLWDRRADMGETGRGAELEPDVEGRENTESVGEGGGCE